tara:strand:- start:341 stop:760 length:420 start_codon:yes stop_codon:yes gene_type:complete
MISIENVDFETIKNLIPQILELDEGNIDTKLREQPSIYTLFAAMHAEAIHAQTKFDLLLEETIARKQIAAKVSTTKKLTVADMEAIIGCDEEVKDCREDSAEATYKVNLLKGVLRGLEHQKDCLIQISANKRKEKDLYT